MVSKKLLCLCNDNSDCVLNALPESLLQENLTAKSPKFGHCVTTTEGSCYTVKDTNIPISSASIPERRRAALFSQRSTFDLENATKSKRIEGVQADSLQTQQDILESDVYFDIRYGCLSSHAQVTLSCNGHLVNHLVPKTIACCNSSDFCNVHLSPKFVHHPTPRDAFEAAVKNWRTNDQVAYSNKLTVLNPGLNIGPNLLNGGKVIYSPPSKGYHAPNGVLQHSRSSIFSVIFITTFGVIAMILGLLCVGVYYCYKRKLRKGELRLLETHLWYPSPHGHRDNCRHLPSSLLTNSWLSQPRPTSTKSIILCVRRKMQASRKRNYGSQPHTTSSNLTRTLGSSLDGLIAENHKAELTRYGQRAISRQVCLRCFLGRGRFSDVWMGLWRGEPVTVKIFAANDRLGQILWRRTITAHRSMLLRHRNVQGIMATDWIQYPLEEHGQLWPNFAKQCAIGSPILHAMFISELFQLGTLRDLMDRYVWLVSDASGTEDNACAPVHTVYALTRESAIEQPPILTVAEEQLMKVVLRLALSLTQGLCFLHSDYVGTRGKPALAHRDLKPSNVFVRSDWTCCIGDVGFSVRAPPNPLPSSMSELNRLYCQHIAQLQTSGTQPVLPIHSPQPAELLTENEKLHHELHNNATEVVTYHEPTANTIKEGVQLRPASKLRMNKAELLDWWPVGGLQAGTPRYMAPELLNSSANPFRLESHQRADIYSLGLVLWELIIWALPQYLHPKTRQLSQISSSRSSCSTRSSPDPVAEEDLHSLTLEGPQTLRFRGPAYQSEWEQLCARGDTQSDIPPSSLTTPDNNSGCHLPLDRTLKETSIVPPTEPSLFIMRQLVCELQLRPRLPVVFITGMPYVAKETVPSPSALCSRLADEEFNSKAQVADPDAVLKSTSVESSSGASSLRDAPTGSNTTTVAYADNSTKILLTDLIRMVLSHFATLLPECWAPDPDSRLTALRIRKTLERTCDLIDATRGLTSGTKLDPHHPAANDGDCVNDPMAIKQILC